MTNDNEIIDAKRLFQELPIAKIEEIIGERVLPEINNDYEAKLVITLFIASYQALSTAEKQELWASLNASDKFEDFTIHERRLAKNVLQTYIIRDKTPTRAEETAAIITSIDGTDNCSHETTYFRESDKLSAAIITHVNRVTERENKRFENERKTESITEQHRRAIYLFINSSYTNLPKLALLRKHTEAKRDGSWTGHSLFAPLLELTNEQLGKMLYSE